MTKQERITKNILADKELIKAINNETYVNSNDFIDHGKRYINAIKQGRMINVIDKVSASGMSRTLKFTECSKGGNGYNYLNFFLFFRILGYSPADSSSHYFRVHGCGMDMVFHTNYEIIHKLHRLGFISKKECAKLAQMTPTTI